ncbi:MAG: nuclear transport factor 2 family protein [Candidatus Omnitrophica bacterium]|nr:nuclear transport factor 2 family protein [Candidatus Omnitrophota bacterium]MCA9436197.1 nuclear transport factor 2 family protein [Candidatus Omnitrophota bacterium]MCB9766773.1 nuclear transport factor 2 family protein [Candidatus Omnitrophota bacterium]
MTDIRTNIQELIQGLLDGKILETFEKFYDDEVIMSENRVDERVGKEANRQHEEFFVKNFTLNSLEFGEVIVEGNRAAIESTWDITFPDGNRVVQRQVSVQIWKDGRIIREDFYHA